MQIDEESSEDSDDVDARKKITTPGAKKTAGKSTFDRETLAKAQEKASEVQKSSVLSAIPRTSAGFEKDFKALKNDEAGQMKYLQNIPLGTLESIFKKSEV